MSRFLRVVWIALGWLGTVQAGAITTDSVARETSTSRLSSDEKLRQFMAQVRPQPVASQAGAQAVREAAVVSAERLQERADLLKAGETALAAMQVEPALQAFERAALILHAADTEIALVRAYMQGGEYRRALAFGAHTAGAHLDVVGGAALYAWLLHVGGQVAVAQRLLSEAQARMPGNPVVQAVQLQLRSNAPLATGALLNLPTRLAPYGDARGLPPAARVAGSAMLLPKGQHALVPLALLPGSGAIWMRNGLGQLSKAVVVKRLPAIGLAQVRLKSSLPLPDAFSSAPRDAFPGSAGFALEYVPAPDAGPAWPVLRSGFVGGVEEGSSHRLLGIEMPRGPHGGPVFDAAGRWIGLALPGAPGAAPRVVMASQLPPALRGEFGLAPPTRAPANLSVDSLYELGLRCTLQVIVLR